jgi:hypothetical protein
LFLGRAATATTAMALALGETGSCRVLGTCPAAAMAAVTVTRGVAGATGAASVVVAGGKMIPVTGGAMAGGVAGEPRGSTRKVS